MTRTLRVLAAAAALAAAPGLAQAQVTFGPTLAYHNDADFGLGAALGVPLPEMHPNLGFVADFVVFFPDAAGLDLFEINGGVTYDLPVEGATVLPFALAGLNIARFSVDVAGVSASNTELGLNIGGGIKFDAGPVRPMVGLRLEIEGGDGFVFFGTIPFAIGR